MIICGLRFAESVDIESFSQLRLARISAGRAAVGISNTIRQRTAATGRPSPQGVRPPPAAVAADGSSDICPHGPARAATAPLPWSFHGLDRPSTTSPCNSGVQHSVTSSCRQRRVRGLSSSVTARPAVAAKQASCRSGSGDPAAPASRIYNPEPFQHAFTCWHWQRTLKALLCRKPGCLQP